MNLKQLYIFGMENSQEPVIKNPVLRAALEGPSITAQEPRNMAHGGRIPFGDGLTVNQQQKIINTFPKMKLEFTPTQTYGVKKYYLGDRRTVNKDWTRINRFIKKGYTTEMGEGKTTRGEPYKVEGKRLSIKDQNKIKALFDLPEGVKEWDFTKSGQKYGFKPDTIDKKNLVAQMTRKLKEKSKWTVAANRGSAKGWMTEQMYRVYKKELKNPHIKKLTYEPEFDIFDDGSKKGRQIIVGFKDNTKAGGGKTYYGLKKWSKKNAANWTKHGDWKLNKKLVDISKRALQEPNEVIMGLLKKKGFTGKVKLSDLIHYLSSTPGTSKDVLKNAVTKHHESGVAFGSATDDIALTTRTINNRIKGIEGRIRANDILPDDIQTLKNNNIYVRHEGKVYGSGSKTAIGQFKQIEKFVERGVESKDFNVKKLTSYLENLGCPKPGKASGGRVGFATGTNCAIKGREVATRILKNGTASTEQKAILRQMVGAGAAVLKGTGKFVGNILNPKEFFKLRNLVGPEAMAFMAGLEGGIIGYDVINNNTPIKQALGANWMTSWAMPRTLDEYQIEEMRDKGYLSSVSSERFAKSQEMVNDLNRDYAELEFLKIDPTKLENKFYAESIAEKQKAYDAKEQDYFSFVEEGKGMDAYEFEKDRSRMLEERGAGEYIQEDYRFGNQGIDKEGKVVDVNDYGYTGVADETVLKKISPEGWFLQGTPQKKDVRILDERLPPQLGGETSLLKMPKFDLDLTKYEPLPSDYRDRKHEKLTKQDIEDLTNYYRAIGKIKEDEELEDMFYEDTEKSMLEEAQIANKWRQLYGSPGMQGSQDPYAEGGLASLKKW